MSLKKIALNGVFWSFAQQFSIQGVSFLVSIVMARLLLPAEFGIIGMISVFVAIGISLMNSGLTQSLIRTKNPDEEDYSTVFFFNIAGSLIAYLLIFFAAPLIAKFFNQPILRNLLRVLCLSFIITAFAAVHQTRLTIKMDFKTQMTIAVPSLFFSGVLGISLAYFGWGVWSLVYMALLQTFLNSAQYWIKSNWRPSFVFNKSKFIYHFYFGYKLTLSGLLDTVFNNIYQIIIGKFFSAAQLGFFTRADSLKQLPVVNISTALDKVTYPLFASINNDDIQLKKIYKQIMQMVVFIITPILVFLGVLAEPLFRFLFTEKWLPAVPYFQILCLTGILYPIHSYNLNILKVKGRSDLFLKLEIYKKLLIAISIIIAIRFGILGLLWSQVIISILAFFINTHYSGQFINYKAFEQVKDITPILVLAAFAGVIVFGVNLYLLKGYNIDLLRISVGLITGFIVYLVTSWKLKFTSISDIKLIILKK